MPIHHNIQAALKQVRDQQSFFNVLLAKTLDWPIRNVSQVEDIAYGWSAEDLNATHLEKDLLSGSIWQLQPADQHQPWGIFILDFKRPELLSLHRGMAGVLRLVLRGLVGSRRKDAKLPSWKKEHLLFICTHGWQSFRFAYFRAKPDDPKASRLTTFAWAPGTSNRTVCEFNLPALIWPDDLSDTAGWVRSWSKAFDKEPLTKDFFRRFDDALDAVKKDLQEYQKLTPAEAYTQAQLLLERLIFLYFLQNRGWLNQDRRFLLDNLTEHLAKPKAFTYYSEFLDRLFWTLSSAPGEGGRLQGIPFLNGGLFDDDEFRQPAGSRKTNPPLKIRNATFNSVFADLLEAFNFTVTEDTPLNQEVAVDPEMLGKVFESIVLHAEAADPDATAPDKRKATGSYYTPRIVVHFICREVLYQYLHARLVAAVYDRRLEETQQPKSDVSVRRSQTAATTQGSPLKTEDWSTRLRTLLEMDASDGLDDEAKELLKRTITPAQAVQLRDLVQPLKCCDPAVGSGAFPVGLLHELVNLRRLLTTAANGYVDPMRGEGSTWLHETKADIVEHCLYGVDIQQQAIEICRLRLWLTMVVDYDLGLEPFTAEKSQFSNAINRISQLPNLEMNFHRGDSLHDHICGVPIVILPDRASRHADAFDAIYKLGEKFHKAKTGDTKRKLRLEILDKRLALSASILQDELKALEIDDSKLNTFFGLDESAAEKRKRFAHEATKLAEALKEVEKNRDELERLKRKGFDSQFFPKLRKLEGADFDSPFNFAWTIDFPGVFSSVAAVYDRRDDSAADDLGAHRAPLQQGGFDIIVGNPPFVTARNPKKRELWRERWPLVCLGKYHLLCPFFELGFDLLNNGAQLGFIVSNAFAKREFGKPLVESFFPSVQLQKIVDCSGLMFPGHGTPTCLVFGRREAPDPHSPIRVAGILPGGGDLRTPPEESVLWRTLAQHHDTPGFQDTRVIVADRSRSSMSKWPCNFDSGGEELQTILEAAGRPLLGMVEGKVGPSTITRSDEVFVEPPSLLRSVRLSMTNIRQFIAGDSIRNWTIVAPEFVVFPYREDYSRVSSSGAPPLFAFLRPYKEYLENVIIFDKPKKLTPIKWWEYTDAYAAKNLVPRSITFPEIATHAHFVFQECRAIYPQTAPVLKFPGGVTEGNHHLLAGLANSGTALFWLKQACFNKGSGEEEERDRFVYAGGKVEQLPVPGAIAERLKGKTNSLAAQLTELSKACWERGQQMPSLSLKKLFAQPGEAYHEWNSSLPGYVPPNPELFGGHRPPLQKGFETADDLREANRRAQTIRERLRGEMIALQEEMDWLVYAAYGLLPESHPAVVAAVYDRRDDSPVYDRRDESPVYDRRDESPVYDRRDESLIDDARKEIGDHRSPLQQAERPFRFWQQVEGDYAKAVALIPAGWPAERRTLWEARLAAIRDNEHIRRIEQPVYKRRWDEQWKVGNQWRSGPVAYAAEFVDAFEWWLSEKAEWWLEHKKNGGPVELDDWAAAIWKDSRVQAAWPVAAENYALLEADKKVAQDPPSGPAALQVLPAHGKAAKLQFEPGATGFSEFSKVFKRIIDDETVPEDIPFAVPYDDLENRKIKISPKVKRIRGKLNVPRERFHLRGHSDYLWAGLQFK
ncbi:MAG: Eco57I restriction-modification methylase domain-containing protein [Terriglobia bacterium]